MTGVQEKAPRFAGLEKRLLRKADEQLVVDAAEAAVAHDEQHVVRVHMGDHIGHDVIHILAHVGISLGEISLFNSK